MIHIGFGLAMRLIGIAVARLLVRFRGLHIRWASR
jgi:hypothetical protein